MAVTEIPGFDLEGELGRGGSATVYAAYQSRFDRYVAIKVFSEALGPKQLNQFEREMKAHGRLSAEPAFVTVYSDGLLSDGRPYLVMDRLTGGSLDELSRETGPLPWEQVVDIVAHLSDAMQVAHDAGIIHGDLKPSNVLLDSMDRPVITDFGIARILGTTSNTAGPAGLTAAYAPREVVEGQRPEQAADVYGLAAIAYALLAGHPPITPRAEEATSAFFMRLLDEGPEPLVVNAPPAVVQVIEQVLHCLASDRPTAAQFAEWLRISSTNRTVGATEPAPRPPDADMTQAPEEFQRRAQLPMTSPVDAPVPLPQIPPLPGQGSPVPMPPASYGQDAPVAPPPPLSGQPQRSVVPPQPRTKSRISTKVLVGLMGLLVLVGGGATAAVMLSGAGAGSSTDNPSDGAPTELVLAVGQIADGLRNEAAVAIDTPASVTAAYGSIWVVNTLGNELVQLDSTGQELTRIAVPDTPVDVVGGPDAVWVASSRAQVVTAFDPNDNSVVRQIELTSEPTALAVTERGVWIAHAFTGGGSYYDLTTEELTEFQLGSQPANVETSSGDGAVWFTTIGGGGLIGFRGSDQQPIGTFPFGGGPEFLAAGGGKVWVTQRGNEGLRSAELGPLQAAVDDSSEPAELDEGPRASLPGAPGPVVEYQGGLWVLEQFVDAEFVADTRCQSTTEAPRLWALESNTGLLAATIDLGELADIQCGSAIAASIDGLWITDLESNRLVFLARSG